MVKTEDKKDYSKFEEVKEVKKLTEVELTGLKEAITKVNNIQMQIGGIEAQKYEYLGMVKTASEELQLVQKDLEEAYGQVNIDINTGEIQEQVEPNTED
jgi:ribonuclease HII